MVNKAMSALDKFLDEKPGNRFRRFKGPKPENPVKNKMASVYRDTVKYFRNKGINDEAESVLYDIDDLDIDLEEYETYEPTIVVEDIDSLDMAMKMHQQDIKQSIMVLNMASFYCPGGGVKSGARAQEEEIFRRSDAFMTHDPDWYPLDSNEVIYSPEVTIIKDSNYELIPEKKQLKVSMLAVPAIRKPQLNRHTGEYMLRGDQLLMQKKIDSIFLIGIQEERDTLVLGALGCGAYNNPAGQVSQMFRRSLARYGRYFKRIGFAVLVVNRGDTENLERFQKLSTD